MNIIYIFGITILLTGGTDSLIEDTKTDKSQQRILLRKLQNFQDAKSLTWNEILADVLVNKISIFSFKNQDKEDMIKDVAPVSKERSGLTDFFSKVFVVYKKFIYDTFVGKREEKLNGDEITVNSVPLNTRSDEEDSKKIESEETIKPNEITFAEGPKSEVELVEPQYHGKITLEESTTESPDRDDLGKKDNRDDVKDTADPLAENSEDTKAGVNPNTEESVVKCADGFVKGENGNCVISRLILAIPHQCPIGYRPDRLGYCRMIFNF